MSAERIERQGLHSGRRGVWAVGVAGALATLFVAGTYVAPRVASGPGSLLTLAYAPLCHQIAERSLTTGLGVQAVCARCAGLYLGGAAALLLAAGFLGPLARRLRPVVFGLGIAPTLVDALLPWLGFPGLSNVPRLLVALPAGFVAGLFLAIGIADLFDGSGRLGRPARVGDTDTNENTKCASADGQGAPMEVFDG